MDLVRDFIKDQFNDDDDYVEPKRSAGREVQNLKKELEELKFYQELERTEYEDMKRKMHNMEKKKSKSGAKGIQTETIDTEYSNDIFDSISDDDKDKETAALLSKLKKKDEEISRLEKKFKTETDPKEFGKRMYKLEKSKNEEIEEIKTHYKTLMEQLAKQIQKANDRHDDEVKKNSTLRDTMEEMRQDMATREQELEDKLLEMEAVLKKAEDKGIRLAQSLAMAEENLATNQVKLTAALEGQDENDKKMRDLEEDFEGERLEILTTHEREKAAIDDAWEVKLAEVKTALKDVTEQLQDTEDKLQLEQDAHDETVGRLKKTETALREAEKENKSLDEHSRETMNQSQLDSLQAEKEIRALEEKRTRQLKEANDKISELQKEKMALKIEMKSADANRVAADKRVALMNDNTAQKQGAIRRKNAELEQLQLELRNLCDKHLRDTKSKDLQMVRERKKWNASEQVLKKELEEIKMSPAYQRVLIAEKTKPSTESESELRELVEHLRAEKASLLLQMTAVKERSTRDVNVLESKLKKAQKLAAGGSSPDESSRVEKEPEEPLFANVKRSISFRSYSASKPSSQASNSSTPSKASVTRTASSRSIYDTASQPSPEVSVDSPKAKVITKKSLSNTAYRRQLRQRKFKKAAE